MAESDVDVLKTKLDILINDFQAHRKQSVKREEIAELKTELRYHTIIGSFIISGAVALLWNYIT